jgi:hypothetical protein
MKEQIQAIHAEAASLDLHSALDSQPKAASTKNFCQTYKTGAVRSALLIAVSFMRLFHRGNVADGIAQTIAFLDATCGGGDVSS